jgi:hypothetical protein
VAPASQKGFGVTELMLSASAPYSPSWISPYIILSPNRRKKHAENTVKEIISQTQLKILIYAFK